MFYVQCHSSSTRDTLGGEAYFVATGKMYCCATFNAVWHLWLGLHATYLQPFNVSRGKTAAVMRVYKSRETNYLLLATAIAC